MAAFAGDREKVDVHTGGLAGGLERLQLGGKRPVCFRAFDTGKLPLFGNRRRALQTPVDGEPTRDLRTGMHVMIAPRVARRSMDQRR